VTNGREDSVHQSTRRDRCLHVDDIAEASRGIRLSVRAPCRDVSRKSTATSRLGGLGGSPAISPHLSLDGVILRRSRLSEFVKRLGLFAIGLAANASAILGVAATEKENLEGWRGAVAHCYCKVRGIAAFGDYSRCY
jgi:hypothetical protein